MNPFSLEVQDAAAEHAEAAFPNESCGLVLGGEYVPCVNVAVNPRNDFEIEAEVIQAAYVEFGDIDGVWHSHTNGYYSPTVADMTSQIDMQVPWGVHVYTPSDDEIPTANYVGNFTFGDHILDEPLIGRLWLPGVRDCFALIRAYWKQTFNMTLPDFPREGDWWDTDTLGLLAEKFSEYPQFSFVSDLQDIRVNDIILMGIRSSIPNHFAVMCEDNLLLHHPAQGLSSRRPLSTLQAKITHLIRMNSDV